jgi:hypothetical protein
VRFRFERELGQLDFSDFAASSDLDDGNVYGGNVDLKPEQRWISEITYERRFWGEGIVSIGYRHDEIIDVIDRLPLPGGLSATGNIGNGTLDRLSVNIVVPTDKWGHQGRPLHLQERLERDPRHRPDHRQGPADLGRAPDPGQYRLPAGHRAWKTQWGINWLPLLGQGTYDVRTRPAVWRGRTITRSFVEYKPTPTLAIRAQLNIWDDFTIRRTVLPTAPPAPVAFVEERDINPRTFVSLRLRKTF